MRPKPTREEVEYVLRRIDERTQDLFPSAVIRIKQTIKNICWAYLAQEEELKKYAELVNVGSQRIHELRQEVKELKADNQALKAALKQVSEWQKDANGASAIQVLFALESMADKALEDQQP